MKVYVGNLKFEIDEDGLKDIFSEMGEIVSCSIIRDRDTGRSKGFGFVQFASKESGEKAISEFDGQDLQGRKLRVSEAREKTRGGGGGGGGGQRRY